MIKKTLFFLVFFLSCTIILAKTQKYKTGDLIFQVNKSSDFSLAVTETTTGKEYNYTHVGIIFIEHDSVFVFEATAPVVCKTPLQNFIEDSKIIDEHYIVVVTRVRFPYQKLIPNAISFAKSALNKAYDSFFIPNNDKYYCSELVYEAFRKKMANIYLMLFP